MILYYFNHKNKYKAKSISFDFNWVVIYYFSEIVNNDKYQVIYFIFLISQIL